MKRLRNLTGYSTARLLAPGLAADLPAVAFDLAGEQPIAETGTADAPLVASLARSLAEWAQRQGLNLDALLREARAKP